MNNLLELDNYLSSRRLDEQYHDIYIDIETYGNVYLGLSVAEDNNNDKEVKGRRRARRR
jgi:hypothetical protein